MVTSVGPLYGIWGAIGLSILVEFALLLHLQRLGRIEISDRGGALGPGAHVALAALLFAVAALATGLFRSRLRTGMTGAAAGRGGDPATSAPRAALTRFLALSVAAWLVAEAYALIGLVLALAAPPVPRLALTLYFTGALLLWLRNRPDARALSAALRGAAPRP